MKILVTGGAGFIGSHVVDLYLAHGHQVVVVDNLATGRRQNLNPAATFYQLDIRDPLLAELFAQERPEVVNHHAAQVSVRESVADPLLDADINIRGSLNLLECSRQSGVQRFIYISSGGAVYGEPAYLPCDEDHPIAPICQYGASKYATELYLQMYCVIYGLEYMTLRYGNVYGPRQDPNGEAGVVAIFTSQMLMGAPVVINGDGHQVRDFVYVGDCAQASLAALNVSGSGTYNLASGQGTSINEVAEMLQELTGYKGRPAHGPAKLGETYKIYLSAERAAQELGWRPQVGLLEGLQRTVDHFRDGRAG